MLDKFSYLPLVANGAGAPPVDPNDIPALVNSLRAIAGAPAVSFDSELDHNCWLHARYMAEENHLTHNENPASAWYTPEGQVCAGNGNAWLGSSFYIPIWEPHDSVDGWMSSPGHRMWLLYPTTPVFGFGFYTASNNRAGAGLDVLSESHFSADLSYSGWPVRYPAPSQANVPSGAFPITVFWRYFGPVPTVSATSLSTGQGASIAHSVSTSLPANHKGILITPQSALPANTTLQVMVAGSYDGVQFSYSWSYTTAP